MSAALWSSADSAARPRCRSLIEGLRFSDRSPPVRACPVNRYNAVVVPLDVAAMFDMLVDCGGSDDCPDSGKPALIDGLDRSVSSAAQ